MRSTMSSAQHLALSGYVAERPRTPKLVVWTSLWSHTLPAMLGEQEQRRRFGYALRKAMETRGISARQLSKRLEVDPRRVAGWQGEKALPNLYESQAIAAALGVDEELFRNPPEVPPPPPEPYYPLEKYLLEAGQSGAAEGHRRASTPRSSPNPGTPSRKRGPRAHANGE